MIAGQEQRRFDQHRPDVVKAIPAVLPRWSTWNRTPAPRVATALQSMGRPGTPDSRGGPTLRGFPFARQFPGWLRIGNRLLPRQWCCWAVLVSPGLWRRSRRIGRRRERGWLAVSDCRREDANHSRWRGAREQPDGSHQRWPAGAMARAGRTDRALENAPRSPRLPSPGNVRTTA